MIRTFRVKYWNLTPAFVLLEQGKNVIISSENRTLNFARPR